MSFTFIRQLPSPDEIKALEPMSEEMNKIKAGRDKLIRDVITGESDKFLVIVGPCSADNEDAVCEYTNRLAKVQEKVADRLVLVPRIYTNKPRTTGEGYKGMLHQPDPEAKPDILAGILAIRHMHIRSISETGLTAADEMLYPDNWHYLSDILSYVAIGARSVENQEHRLMVSGLDIPVGMKNPTSGDFSVMLNSVVAAQGGHDFISRGWEVRTEGNPLTHTILRGAVNKHGNTIPNYHYEDIQLLLEKYEERNLQNPAVLIDANHSNSGKKYEQQIRIVKEILHSRRIDEDIRKLVKGVMIESYLVEGCQQIGTSHVYGKSITD
ncbi:MAG TPA: 3-deoxy-7-phosphoheptulonate synthase, partial [Candidatus Mediterraneibacter gallistercoris]|nr:3-deoxy-7-phosphoheptulonate synthase [Candidatus Mediterraneibacter gallistercoris]